MQDVHAALDEMPAALHGEDVVEIEDRVAAVAGTDLPLQVVHRVAPVRPVAIEMLVARSPSKRREASGIFIIPVMSNAALSVVPKISRTRFILAPAEAEFVHHGGLKVRVQVPACSACAPGCPARQSPR